MSAEDLLQRLEKVKKTGQNKWYACCPAHNDKRPSLTICEQEDGRVLVHCFAGCGAADILVAVGLDFTDLYPPTNLGHHSPKIRKPWTAMDALRCMSFESLYVLQFAKSITGGWVPSEADNSRLFLSAERLQRAMETAQ